ncbi:MAG TPA: MFS transporter [Thermoplasmata archaeon]|nr:MFS transporter [Thermoplasmata archaeon]
MQSLSPREGEPPPGRSRSIGHSLQARPFRNLFASSATSTLGAAVSLVAVNWIVYHYTRSAIDITYVGLTGIVPGIVLGLFAGVLADRYNRRSLMVTSDLTRMAGMGLLTATLYVEGFSLPLILAVMVLVNCFSALFTPASQAILPRLVPRDSLEDANGLLYSTSGAGTSIGSAVGGVVVALLGSEWGLGVNALTYALSAMFLFQIGSELGRSAQGSSAVRRSFRQDFSEGTGFVFRSRTLVEVMFGYLPSNFLSAWVSPFLVVYAATRFGGSAIAYGALAAALAAGVAAGGLIVGRIATRRIAGPLMGACLLSEGLAYGLLAFSMNLELSVAALLGAGLAIGFANTVYYSTIQAVVPGNILARVLSIGDFGSFAAIPAGLVAGGIVIAIYGIGVAVTIAAIGIFATAAVLLSLPDFRSFGEK